MLIVKDLICGYTPKKPIVGPLSFEVNKGDILCLLGPNGVGKTTLFKTILGLLKPQSGSIRICGKDIREYRSKEFARMAAYVPQGHIPPFPYSVIDVVIMGCNPNMHELSAPRRKDFDTAYEKLMLMGISDLADRDYTEISGGERQLVMIARALAQNTNLLVMDEPTSHLDYGNETRVLAQIKKLSEMGYTIIMITHIPNHAFICANKVAAIGKNKFFRSGSPQEVLTEETMKELYDVDSEISDVTLRKNQRQIKFCMPAIIEP